MSRRNPLEQTIDQYEQANRLKNDYTKEAKKLGDSIKAEFSARGLTEYSSDDYTASISTTTKTDFNEDYAIEIIRREFEAGNISEEVKAKIIRTKEYIDDDALEAVIYSNPNFGQEIKKAFVEKAPVVTLRIKKK